MSSFMSNVGERLRRLSGRASGEADTPKSQGPVSPRDENPWRSTFDPNYNPATKGMGRSYYDTVDDPKTAKSTWDYHLDAEKEKEAAQDVKTAAFTAMGAQNDALDASSLRKMFAADRVDQIMQMADKNKDGKIDFKEFCELVRKAPCE